MLASPPARAAGATVTPARVDLPQPRSAPTAVLPRTTTVVALVPAHNEQDGIVGTVRSLYGQTRAPDRVIVVADNCTDATVELARNAGAQVVETVGNRHRKAGALNQALAAVLPTLHDSDVVLAMDADSQLAPDFVATGLRYLAYAPERGAISGSYVPRADRTTVGLLQRIEYAQGLHTVHNRGGRIHVLSGAACMFTARALRAVAEARGSALLPGPRGWVYHQESLTEDYELTLALKRIGFAPLNARDCTVVTDVMTTWQDWRAQRLRWQRGTLETLLLYGWVPHTRKAWVVQYWTYFRSLVPLMMVLFWAYALAFEKISFQPFWLVIIPVFVLDQVIAAWKAGLRGRVFAAFLIPMWAYDLVQSTVYWRALLLSLRGGESTWTT
jgi:biofilm PGA synthesis N-glycosyltransferase PgaC